MAFSFECSDTGLSCPATFAAETEEDLLRQLDDHYRTAHLGAKPMEYRLKRLIKVSQN